MSHLSVFNSLPMGEGWGGASLPTGGAVGASFPNPFYYQPDGLAMGAAMLVKKELEASGGAFRAAIDEGKMFGVLVVRRDGELGFLKAYSGQIMGRDDYEGWVPAVFDYLQPDGFFKQEERRISAINEEVREMQNDPELASLRKQLAEAERQSNSKIEAYRLLMSDAKAERDNLRRQNLGDEAAMIRESQFMKAELRRLKQSSRQELEPLENAIKMREDAIVAKKRERQQRSDALQRWLFSQFVMINARGEQRNLMDIFAQDLPFPQRGRGVGGREAFPPSGAGECCAPKLLQYAFTHGYEPVTMAEFWWGRSPVGELRRHMAYYPACEGKCRPILTFMLQGMNVAENPLEQQEDRRELEMLYEDEYVIAINKPAGMLSVPGKTGRLSALEILNAHLNKNSLPTGEGWGGASLLLDRGGASLPIHRLDMQTSGVLLFAKSAEVQAAMQREFAERRTKKCYYAILDGEYTGPQKGTISLPLAPDYMNRPRQKVDYETGKEAITSYDIIPLPTGEGRGGASLPALEECVVPFSPSLEGRAGVGSGRAGARVVRLFPHTGRTHQLRVHCAHPDGLGIPIVGDDLYGNHADRLMLHAYSLEIRNPLNGKTYHIVAKWDKMPTL